MGTCLDNNNLSSTNNLLLCHSFAGWVTDCQFSSDENRIISSSKDGTLRYWNVENYEWLPVVFRRNNGALRIVQCQVLTHF